MMNRVKPFNGQSFANNGSLQTTKLLRPELRASGSADTDLISRRHDIALHPQTRQGLNVTFLSRRKQYIMGGQDWQVRRNTDKYE
jgi:hypothetical protein